MALDEAILVEARRAQDRMATARREADRARADFVRHIRRLHAGGASLREVGESLDLSHQRVHQIIDAGRPQSDEQTIICRCSFCGRAEPEVSKVIAGPGVYICNLCVGTAIGVASGAPPELEDPTAMATVVPDLSSGLKCSFCGRSGTKAGAVVVGVDAQICITCLDLCEEIVAEKPQPDRT